MDDYGVSSFTILRMLGPMLVIGPVMLWLLVTGPFVLYPLARWRDRAGATPDGQLGLKFALEYFRMLSFQLALFGIVIVLFMLFAKMPSDDKGVGYRFGFGFLIPAALLFAGHMAMLEKTNQREFRAPRRLFAGYNLVITGLVGMTSFVLVFQALFTKGSSGDMGRFAAASLITYGGAWAACGIRFLRLVHADPTAPPPIVREAPKTTVQPPPQAGLPSLGGGAFPPIER
jgi:hypothetical protein